jgi:hypothetical protein
MAVACGLVGAFAFNLKTALAAMPTCETQTQRSVSDVIVPFRDADTPQLSAQAVKLVPGESLCLTGNVDEAGDLQGLRLLRPGETATLIIALSLDRGEVTRLSLHHSSQRWLYYDALRLVTEQDVALPTSTLPVAPGLRAMESWDHGVRKLLLHGFRFGGAPAQPVARRPPRVRDTSKLNASATFGFWGGERSLHTGDLDRVLARDDFASLQRVGIMGGLDLDFTFGRVRAGVSLGAGGRTIERRSDGRELSTSMLEVAFTAGYDIIRYDQLHVFLGSGLGVADLYVEHTAGLTAFPDVQPWEGKRVKFSALEVPLDIGSDYFVPFARASGSEKWMLQFGARIGWSQQVGSGGWETDVEKSSRDLSGPNVDLSGLRARLVIGIGAQNGW